MQFLHCNLPLIPHLPVNRLRPVVGVTPHMCVRIHLLGGATLLYNLH